MHDRDVTRLTFHKDPASTILEESCGVGACRRKPLHASLLKLQEKPVELLQPRDN